MTLIGSGKANMMINEDKIPSTGLGKGGRTRVFSCTFLFKNKKRKKQLRYFYSCSTGTQVGNARSGPLRQPTQQITTRAVDGQAKEFWIPDSLSKKCSMKSQKVGQESSGKAVSQLWKHQLTGVQSRRQGMSRRRNEARAKGEEANLGSGQACAHGLRLAVSHVWKAHTKLRSGSKGALFCWVVVNKQLVWMPLCEGTIESSRKTHDLTARNHERTSPLPYWRKASHGPCPPSRWEDNRSETQEVGIFRSYDVACQPRWPFWPGGHGARKRCNRQRKPKTSGRLCSMSLSLPPFLRTSNRIRGGQWLRRGLRPGSKEGGGWPLGVPSSGRTAGWLGSRERMTYGFHYTNTWYPVSNGENWKRVEHLLFATHYYRCFT